MDSDFEITNWPGAKPALKRVYDVKVKKLDDTPDCVCSLRQYIDGEYMGAASFDENNMATLSLNTAGLEKGRAFV